MVTFTEKFTGAKANLFAKVCLHYIDAAEKGCNDDPHNIPLFSWLSPYQRVQLVRQVMIGLICPEEPLPPNTIQHYATYRAMVETLLTEIEVELDLQWDCENVGEDLRLDDNQDRRRRRSDEEMAERNRNLELIRHRAEKNKYKLDKKGEEDVGEYDFEEKEFDSQKRYRELQDIAGTIFDGKPLSKKQRGRVRRPSNPDEQCAFRWRCLCDEAFQEDTADRFPLSPLAAVTFDFRSNSCKKWHAAIDLLFVTFSGAEADRKEASLVYGAIDECAYADVSQHARIQAVKKHISILRKIYESKWDENVLAEDQRCIFAISSNECFYGYGHGKFVKDFLTELESQKINFRQPGNYQERYDIYKEIAPSYPEGLNYPFHSCDEHSTSFDACDIPSNYEHYLEQISVSCARHGCYSYDPDKLQTCSRCLVVCYCSRECQLAVFERHKSDCKAMAKLRKDKAAVAELAKNM